MHAMRRWHIQRCDCSHLRSRMHGVPCQQLLRPAGLHIMRRLPCWSLRHGGRAVSHGGSVPAVRSWQLEQRHRRIGMHGVPSRHLPRVTWRCLAGGLHRLPPGQLWASVGAGCLRVLSRWHIQRGRHDRRHIARLVHGVPCWHVQLGQCQHRHGVPAMPCWHVQCGGGCGHSQHLHTVPCWHVELAAGCWQQCCVLGVPRWQLWA